MTGGSAGTVVPRRRWSAILESWPERLLTAALVLGPPAYVVLVVASPMKVQLALFALPAVALAAWLGLRHPVVLVVGLAFLLGSVPVAKVPFTGVPLVQLLCAGVVLATLVHRTVVARVTAIEVGLWLLLLTSTLSAVVTASTRSDWLEYAKWLIATLLAVALCRLDTARLHLFGRVFVLGATGAAAFALVIRFFDPSGRLIFLLKPLGYGKEADPARYVYYAGSQTLRLAGTYVDPNAAGLFFFVALVLALLLLRGWWRALAAPLLFLALLLTLSRSAIFSVVVAAVLLLVFGRVGERLRAGLALMLVLAPVAAFAVPTIRDRLTGSFGASDTGSNARLDALRDFPGLMTGHWSFGRGWGVGELTDPALVFTTNIVANTPLLTIYRGGMVAGLGMVVLLVVGCVVGGRLMRSASVESAMAGAALIGFILVALQLDFPVVTLPPVTAVFSVLLAFVARCDLERRPAPPDEGRLVPLRRDAGSAATPPTRAVAGHATAGR